MIIEKKASLQPIFKSRQGVHLTAYLVNRGDLDDLKRQLETVIQESNDWLYGVLSETERK